MSRVPELESAAGDKAKRITQLGEELKLRRRSGEADADEHHYTFIVAS